jgi:hypothetical protein
MLDHMTVLALRYATHAGRFQPSHDGASGFVRAPRARTPMDESRQQQVQALREQIERGEYEVDPRRVADAIVSRLLTVLVTAPARR